MPNGIKQVPIERISVDIDLRVRENKDLDNDPEFLELMHSIRQYGLLEPIIINEKWKLIAGFRRLTAVKKLGGKTIECKILKGTTSLSEKEIELEENIKRKNLSFYETCVGYARLKIEYEEKYPEAKHGGFMAIWREKGQPQLPEKTIDVKLTTIDPLKSFVNQYAEVFSISERSLYRKVKIGTMILNKEFPETMIEQIKKDEITQTEILACIKKIRKKYEFKTTHVDKDASTPRKAQISNKKDKKKNLTRKTIISQTQQDSDTKKTAINDVKNGVKDTEQITDEKEIKSNDLAIETRDNSSRAILDDATVVKNVASIDEEIKKIKKKMEAQIKKCGACEGLVVGDCTKCGALLFICNEGSRPVIVDPESEECQHEKGKEKTWVPISSKTLLKIQGLTSSLDMKKETIDDYFEILTDKLMKIQEIIKEMKKIPKKQMQDILSLIEKSEDQKIASFKIKEFLTSIRQIYFLLFQDKNPLK